MDGVDMAAYMPQYLLLGNPTPSELNKPYAKSEFSLAEVALYDSVQQYAGEFGAYGACFVLM